MSQHHDPLLNSTTVQALPSAPPVFGCIIPSRPVFTNLTHLPPNRFLLQFHEPDSINHLVVFLTGIVPLPDNYAASIHLQLPEKPDWLLLGMLSATKPSAIFRLRGTMVRSHQASWSNDSMSLNDPGRTATLGILVGPLEEIQAECSALNQAHLAVVRTSPPSATTPANSKPIVSGSPSQLLELAKAIGLNLFRFLSSFSTTTTTINDQNQTWIPISVLEKWWKTFELKLTNSPNPHQWLLDSSSAG